MTQTHTHDIRDWQWQTYATEAGNPMLNPVLRHPYLMRIYYHCLHCGRVKRATQSASTGEWRAIVLDEFVIRDQAGKIVGTRHMTKAEFAAEYGEGSHHLRLFRRGGL